MTESAAPASPSSTLGLPPFDQICLVVPNLDAALRQYEPLFGPFVVLRNGPFDSYYRGRPVSVDLAVAFGRSGGIEIELVEPLAGSTPHRDFLDAGRSGLQHVRHCVDDIDAWEARMAPLGYAPVWWGSYPATNGYPATRWSYLERYGDPVMIELMRFG